MTQPRLPKIVLGRRVRKKKEGNWLPPAIAALFVWGFWAFLPKLALQTLPPHTILFYEGLGNLFVVIPILIYQKFRLKSDPKALTMVGVSSSFTALAILAYFYALQNGPVAVIITMTAMYPVISLVMARIFLQERINKVQKVAVLAALASLLLLALPA